MERMELWTQRGKERVGQIEKVALRKAVDSSHKKTPSYRAPTNAQYRKSTSALTREESREFPTGKDEVKPNFSRAV